MGTWWPAPLTVMKVNPSYVTVHPPTCNTCIIPNTTLRNKKSEGLNENQNKFIAPSYATVQHTIISNEQ